MPCPDCTVRCRDVNHNLLSAAGHECSVSQNAHRLAVQDVSLTPVSYKGGGGRKKSVLSGRN